MYHHSITFALAQARIADLQRAATHSTGTMPPRRHRGATGRAVKHKEVPGGSDAVVKIRLR